MSIAVLAETGADSAQGGAKLVARLDPPRIIWANEDAETLFGTRDREALKRQIFGGDANARAMSGRLGRLSPGSQLLERVVIATRFSCARVTLACEALVEGGVRSIVFRTPGDPSSGLNVGHFAPAALQHLIEGESEAPEAVGDHDAGQRARIDESEHPPRSWERGGDEPYVESVGRAPSRFVWATDDRGAVVRFDPRVTAVLGRNAPQIGENLPRRLRTLGAESAAQAIDEGRSWSGLSISWPLDDAEASRGVVMSGAPSPGRTGGFRGFLALSPVGVVTPSEAHHVVGNWPPPNRPVEAEAVEAAIDVAPKQAFDQARGESVRSALQGDDEGAASASPDTSRESAVELLAIEAAQASKGGRSAPDAEALTEDGSKTAEPMEVETPAAVVRSHVIPLSTIQAAAPSKVVHLATFKTGIASFSGQATVKLIEASRSASAETGDLLDIPLWAEAPDAPVSPDNDERDQRLSSNERLNFDAIRRTLAALPVSQRNIGGGVDEVEPSPETISPAPGFSSLALPSTVASGPIRDGDAWALLECLAIGILVVQAEQPVYGNRAILDLLGYGGVEDLAWTGLAGLFGTAGLPRTTGVGPQTMTMSTRRGDVVAVDARMQKVVWEDGPATLISVRRSGDEEARARVAALGLDLRKSQLLASDLSEALDIAASGVGFLDAQGRILSVNLGAERLFGFDQREIAGELSTNLIAPDQQESWSSFLGSFAASAGGNRTSAFRRFEGRHRDGATIRLAISLRLIDAAKICVIWQQSTPGQGAESEVETLRQDAERSSALKSDFLAKVSHEIRTPLNAILGFTEIIIDERFGAIGNDRYRDYLKDIHASGTHVLSLINDLLDLSRIEAGGLDLNLIPVNANVIVGECVATLQGQAHRDRIIIRTSLAARSPLALADERTFRQIVLNLLSNAVKFNEPGGQVIVSTAVTESGFVVVRVRDTGLGMSKDEIQTAMMPYRQLATLKARAGSGLGLPLTKAMIEASRGSLRIQSKPGEGTLVEVTFQHAPEAAVSVTGLSDSTAG